MMFHLIASALFVLVFFTNSYEFVFAQDAQYVIAIKTFYSTEKICDNATQGKTRNNYSDADLFIKKVGCNQTGLSHCADACNVEFNACMHAASGMQQNHCRDKLKTCNRNCRQRHCD